MAAYDAAVMPPLTIAPDDARLQYSDCVAVHIDAQRAHFGRPGPPDGGFNYDSPGARIRFNCRAGLLQAHFFYNGLHGLLDACQGTGLVLIDGGKTATFSAGPQRPGDVTFAIELPADGAVHLCELVLPYGDSVDFLGLTLPADAHLETPGAERPSFRLVTYGDSITHGFWAGDVSGSWPYQVGQINDWQVVNLGYAGRQAAAEDGLLVAATPADAITLLIGVNDCLNSKPVERYRADVRGLLDNIRRTHAQTPTYVITPLAVPGASWQTQIELLEDFRVALRALVAERTSDVNSPDGHLYLVEGEGLIPSLPEYFADGLHPNDAGFTLLAQNLAPLIFHKSITVP